MIRVQIDEKAYGSKTVLSRFHLDVAPGEVVCLLGPSGCGKTTLLNILAGLDSHFRGSVHHEGRAPILSYMFQEPRLLPWRTLKQNLTLVAPDAGDRVERVLSLTGLLEYRDYFPGQLSLGMARRAALARSFIVDPDLLLMDEPFVSLDPPTAEGLRQHLKVLQQEKPALAILLVTHDIQEALALSDRVLVLGEQPTRITREICLDRRSAIRSTETMQKLEADLRRSYATSDPARQEEQLTQSALAPSGVGSA